MIDKRGDKIYTYEELFMDEKVENVEEGAFRLGPAAEEEDYETSYDMEGYANAKFADESQLNSILSLYAGQIQENVVYIRDEYVKAIGTMMDYYVLDKESGTFLKNTMSAIENWRIHWRAAVNRQVWRIMFIMS